MSMATEHTITHKDAVAERSPYYARRVELFEKYQARQKDAVEAARAANAPLTVKLPQCDNKTYTEAVRGVTCPIDVAKAVDKSLVTTSVVAEVDGQEWDLLRPLNGDCTLKFYSFQDREGKDAFWHSSAHVLGMALELELGADLTIGPPIEEGFYYDCSLQGRNLMEGELDPLKKSMEKAIKAKHRFERCEVNRTEALDMFKENKFKVELIENLPEDAAISCYRCGPMVDLCSGPHLPNTGYLKAASVTQASRSHWRADVTKDALTRVYAITFPSKDELKDYEHRIAEAKKRDHRVVGPAQELIMFHGLSPGCAFWLPNGTRIYNTLVDYIREQYWTHEYTEVITPNIFNLELWKISGHADHYLENMFLTDVEKQQFGLKPMNCPSHCLMFGSRKRSYRELPMRLADFGVLHRNEFSGALSGLTRVRRFQQDDAHIFCREDQISAEVGNFLSMLKEVYATFGLDYELALSTRPESFLGEIEQWDRAEAALEKTLNDSGVEWSLNPGDGAFYGPKIDIAVFDALRRRFQCATVQLDFQLPIRFGLKYDNEEGGTSRPVIVHRAILGSVERMFAILTEHYAGKWPFWLSPRQVMIVPVSDKNVEYANEVRRELRKHKFHVQVNATDNKMQKKVREAQLDQFNYILVVGQEEMDAKTVNVRTRDNQVHGQRTISELCAVLSLEREKRVRDCMFATEEGEAVASAAKSSIVAASVVEAQGGPAAAVQMALQMLEAAQAKLVEAKTLVAEANHAAAPEEAPKTLAVDEPQPSGSKADGKKKKGGPPSAEEIAARQAAKQAEIEKKLIKDVTKEGGKKGVEIEGAADMGGLEFFCTTMEKPDGELKFLKMSMEAMNEVPDPDGEERRGGSGHVGKMIFSAGMEALAMVAYVPKDKQDRINATEWLKSVCADAGVKGEIQAGGDAGLATAVAKANPDAGMFTIKMKDAAMAHGFSYLRERGCFPEDTGDDDDDDGDYVYGDDDFPS